VPLPSVVRNHDYQVRALVDAGVKLSLSLFVKDWEDKQEPHNFENEVSVEEGGRIEWTTLPQNATPENEYKTDGRIALGNSANLVAKCKFYLNTPLSGTWRAELVTVKGSDDAFVFSNGEKVITGLIQGKALPAELTIKTTKDNLALNGAVSENHVELRITASQTVGGVTRTYKVTGLTGINNVENYTLIQNM
jgi:hypothetical protein